MPNQLSGKSVKPPILLDLHKIPLTSVITDFDLLHQQLCKIITQPGLHNGPNQPVATPSGRIVYTIIGKFPTLTAGNGPSFARVHILYEMFRASTPTPTRDLRGHTQVGPYQVIRVLAARLF